jgi:ATP-dependent DNA helicase DinG
MAGYHSKPFLMQIAPTGIGKSLIYMAGALERKGRTIILTSTKGLQDQLMRDFSSVGLVEVRGRSNHRCDLTGKSAALGPCRWGHKCVLKDGGCAYYDSIRRANTADLVVTNYAFWLANDQITPGDNLVLDEAHASFDHLVSHYSAEIDLEVLGETTGISGRVDNLTTAEGSAHALKETEKILRHEARRILKEGGNINDLGPLSSLAANLRTLSSITNFTCVTKTYKGMFYVTPVTAPTGKLFRGARFVLLTSATVSRGTAQLLGLTTRMVDIYSYPSPFPVSNRPVYWLEGITELKIDRKTGEATDRQWATLIDQIIRSRKDQKGIVHTVSYDRREKYLHHSNLTGIQRLSPRPRDTASMVRYFKQAEPPVVLISPSVTTGYDFPGDECRYQIIAKVPFPDADSDLSRARTRIFPDYPFHYAWQQIVQASGRGVRSETDWCDTIIIDAHFDWLRRKSARLAPDWFLGAIRECKNIQQTRRHT